MPVTLEVSGVIRGNDKKYHPVMYRIVAPNLSDAILQLSATAPVLAALQEPSVAGKVTLVANLSLRVGTGCLADLFERTGRSSVQPRMEGESGRTAA